ncbi:MAG: hypothetical protein M1814_003003 [Vezdaea aestivalis]|nr:MAG: hypothetical protein M1814_003003 [Vezdaea aestivalis]
MAGTQAQQIRQTILGMRKAIKRLDNDSESDESITETTNRSNKLKRKAHYVQEGQLDLPNGPKVYKRKMEHAGYSRYVIFKNPLRLDEDGFELEPDEPNEFADAAAAENNPYSESKLEILLRPLTSAAELPTHPSLSVPYYSNALPQIIDQVSKMSRNEKASLWRIKNLLTKFAGDETWFPCGIFESEIDSTFFQSPTLQSFKTSSIRDQVNGVDHNSEKTADLSSEENSTNREYTGLDAVSSAGTAERDPISVENISSKLRNIQTISDEALDIADTTMVDADAIQDAAKADAIVVNGIGPKIKNEDEGTGEEQRSIRSLSEATTDKGVMAEELARPEEPDRQAVDQSTSKPGSPETGQALGTNTNSHLKEDQPGISGDVDDADEEEGDASESQPAPHRMRTRAQAQAASENNTANGTRSQSPAASEPPQIHPIFLVPESAIPDRTFGLPPVEAEQMQRILWQYVQKQEEICRNVETMYQGLLKANRLRKTVLKWAKAEAHVGEMSDGEDWYDKEEWGLDEDLKKGHEEEEEDGNQGKKTRGRRA